MPDLLFYIHFNRIHNFMVTRKPELGSNVLTIPTWRLTCVTPEIKTEYRYFNKLCFNLACLTNGMPDVKNTDSQSRESRLQQPAGYQSRIALQRPAWIQYQGQQEVHAPGSLPGMRFSCRQRHLHAMGIG